MFYVDIDNKKFVAPPDSDSLQRPPSGCSFPPSCPPPARSWESLCGPYRHTPHVEPVKKPVLIHTQVAHLQFALVHEDFSPVDVTDKTFVLAVDNNFDHKDQLIAFSEDFTSSDSSDGVVSFNLDCSSVKFEKMLQAHVPASQIMMQMICYDPGSAQGTAILQDRGIQLRPRIYAWQGAPDPASPNYYTKAQVDSLIKGGIAQDSDSSTGYILNGTGNPSAQLGYPGDVYINTTDQSIWLKSQTQWAFLGYMTDEPLKLYYEIIEDL